MFQHVLSYLGKGWGSSRIVTASESPRSANFLFALYSTVYELDFERSLIQYLLPLSSTCDDDVMFYLRIQLR